MSRSESPTESTRAAAPTPHPRTALLLVPWVFTGLTILGHISWILAGSLRDAITIGSVITFFLASATHAWITRGFRWTAAYLIISLGLGLLVESIGRSTGFPFGVYDYTDSLGVKLLGVPVVIPLAWAMMAYPTLLAAQRLTRSPVVATLIGAWLLATWDVFLDPQMVAESHWEWADPNPALWGVPGIPLSNYAGWLLTALAMMALLNLLPRRSVTHDGVPTTMLAWVYASNILANLVFLGRPYVALWGGVLMGLAVIPWAVRIWPSIRDNLRRSTGEVP